MEHATYPPDYIDDILKSTKTIAIVGASPKANRPSHDVMEFLQAKGYRVFPVNPAAAGETILGEPVYADLSDLPMPVDMVDIFRRSEAAGAVVDEALSLAHLPKTIWMQLDVRDDAAAARAEQKGVNVVMNRCPKIELNRMG
jgi:predicted CoA-binding protein